MHLRTILFIASLVLLLVNGVVHGIWTYRWEGLTEQELNAAQERLQAIPLKLPNWEGRVIENENNNIPEEMTGKNISVRYIHPQTGKVVVVYLACARTLVLTQGHTPLDCYPANGFQQIAENASLVSIPVENDPKPNSFATASFTKGEGSSTQLVRVFWAWNSGNGEWKTLDQVGKSFYRTMYVYKCYVLRSLVRADEPLEGDACTELLKELIPVLNPVLAPAIPSH